MAGEETLKDLLQLSIVKNIFDALEDGIIIVDRSCRVLFYNQAVSRAEGLDSTDVVGKSLFEVFPSLTLEDSTLSQVLKNGTPILGRFQQYFNYKGRQLKTLNTTIPIMEDGTIIGALEVSRDISVVVALTEKVAELRGIPGDRVKPGPRVRYTFDHIIGSSKKIRHLIDLLERVSRTSSSVFLYGETGTGKELFAQSIHNAGPRKNKPFVAQNCAALPESILEGILFGTTKGSFTGAMDKPGLFEQAQGGTILLDEINSMGVALQAKILRVLQEGVVRRLGGGEDIAVDVKIIVTANERPEDLLRTGKLREDLYYRLNVIYAEIPPLRDRMEDLEELVSSFVKKYNLRFIKNVSGVEAGLIGLFRQYSWPGNIRELEHIIEALMNVADEGQLTTEHLGYLGFGAFKDFLHTMPEPHHSGLREDVQEYEKIMILDVLRQCEGNVSHAARKMGMKRQALQYRMRKYGIRVER